MTNTQITIQSAAAEMIAYAVELEAVTANDFILAYDTGIAIGFGEDNSTPHTTTIIKAATVGTIDMPEDAWAYTPIVKNGHNEQAKVVRRDVAAKRYARSLRELAANLQRNAA